MPANGTPTATARPISQPSIPVLWARRFFAEMEQVDGDVGAKHLIGAHEELVHEVGMPDSGVLIDIDSPEALADMVRPKQG